MEKKFLYDHMESKLIKSFLKEDVRENLISWVNLKWKELYYDKIEKNKTNNESAINRANHYRYLQEIKDITKANDHFQVVKADGLAGRTLLNLGPNDFPKEFWENAEEHAKKINPNCEFEYVSIVKYSSEFGEPTLRPHFDSPTKAVFLLDYQLDGNIIWPISVNLEEYALENNECLIFDNNKSIHWRTPKKFQDGQFLFMIFYSFIDENKEIVSLNGQSDELEKYYKSYMDQYNGVFGQEKSYDDPSYQMPKLAELFRWAQERHSNEKQ